MGLYYQPKICEMKLKMLSESEETTRSSKAEKWQTSFYHTRGGTVWGPNKRLLLRIHKGTIVVMALSAFTGITTLTVVTTQFSSTFWKKTLKIHHAVTQL